MIQDITPHKMYNEFRNQLPKLEDFCICYVNNKTLLKKTQNNYEVPQIKEILFLLGKKNINEFEGHYLLSVDEQAYFIADYNENFLDIKNETYEFVSNRTFRFLGNLTQRLAGITSVHIAHWESQNKYCGCCGKKMQHSIKERSLVCSKCQNTVFPRISPVVIVAVYNGDELLMARNLDHPDKSRLFLISGFVEVGESLEQAVEREVFEEAGVHIKNIKYFGSQPWPFSDSLIAGFTAELNGDSTIHIQESEIEQELWVNRKEIPPYDTSVSISCALIEAFRNKLF